RVLYTPDDDTINGQINGANPGWLSLTFEDGSTMLLGHVFNVQHPETWEWNVVINPYFVGREITFEANATDPGSDDLMFAWSWGDGEPDENSTYYNDGMGPDPYPSPDINPAEVLEVRKHTYTSSGTYAFKLIVEDDDGGIGTVRFELTF
ncbi:MAG: PKD domain-containing protein, partial [Thermoplasmata archaeon]|nr:PKD domain-containing protein [Thermoplasmata archaeon]